jgi:hypothetical protein
VHIRQVHLDERDGHPGERIPQGHAAVGVAGRIDHDEAHALLLRLMNAVDERPLQIALEAGHVDPG